VALRAVWPCTQPLRRLFGFQRSAIHPGWPSCSPAFLACWPGTQKSLKSAARWPSWPLGGRWHGCYTNMLASVVVIGALFIFPFRATNRNPRRVLFSYPRLHRHSGRVAQPQHPAWLGVAHYLHSRSSHLKNALDAVATPVSKYADWIPQFRQLALFALVVVIALWLAQRRGQLVPTLAGVGWKGAGLPAGHIWRRLHHIRSSFSEPIPTLTPSARVTCCRHPLCS